MTQKFFDVDFLSGIEAARVFISGVETRSIVAFSTSDLTFSNSNDFNSLFDTDKLDSLAKILDRVKAVAGNTVEGLEGISARTIHNSLHSWSGSSRPPINLQLLFLSVRSVDDVRKPVTSLMSTVFPTGVDNNGSVTLIPPLGYRPNANARSARGTVSIRVGTWFQATGLVVRSAEATYSKEVTKRGTPLFATMSLTLEPFRVITYSEFKNWFVGV